MRGRFAIGLAFAAGLAGCGGDDGGPVAGNCVVGSLNIGEARIVTLGPNVGCRRPAFYESGTGAGRDQSYVAAYDVDLVGGQAYQFTADNNDGGNRGDRDLVLTLYGPGADTSVTGFLAASDDEGYGLGANLIFVAPTSGRYVVGIGTLGDAEAGPAKLSSRACGTQGVIATTGTLTARTITAASCVDYFFLSFDFDSTRVGVFQVQFAAGETKTIAVTSTTTNFRPVVFIRGRGADTFDFINGGHLRFPPEEVFLPIGPTARGTFTAPRAGLYTVLVGNAALTGTSMFDVTVTAGGQSAAAVRAARSARATAAKRR